jgi:hypothetical protein
MSLVLLLRLIKLYALLICNKCRAESKRALIINFTITGQKN